MFAAGLILIILAIIVVVYVIFATSGLEAMSIDWGVFTADLTPLQLFFLGAVTVLVLAIGSVMLSVGLKSQGEKRAEMKRLRKEVEKTHEKSRTETDSPQHSTDDTGAVSGTDTDRDTGTAASGESDADTPVRDAGPTASDSSPSHGRTRPFVRRRPSGETPARPPSYRTSEGSSSADSTPPSST